MSAAAHLLGLQGLGADTLLALLERAQAILDDGPRGDALAGRTVLNLFFEPSTRTRTSFELAARRLGALVVNVDPASASTRKGETLLDTLYTLEAMDVDALVVRHRENGIPALLAQHASGSAIVNAGDGTGEHPTQGLLDLLTIHQQHADFSRLTVTICGDIVHSRVARSDLFGLRVLGTGQVRLCGPRAFLPRADTWPGCHRGEDFDAAIAGADVVIMLRVQAERMASAEVPDPAEYFSRWGLDERRLARAAPGCLVLHPGPINRGTEIAAEVADGPQARILRQVRNGVAVRMAVLETLLTRPA